MKAALSYESRNMRNAVPRFFDEDLLAGVGNIYMHYDEGKSNIPDKSSVPASDSDCSGGQVPFVV